MIIDRTVRWESYIGITPYLKEAVEFALTLKDQPAGRYEYEGLPKGCVYAMVQEGETQPYETGKIEAHRKYLDMQILLEGGETVYYADIEGLTECVPYKEDADVIFYEKSGQPIQVPAGSFYLVLPQDGHMPGRELGGPGRYRKIVLKVRV